MQRWFFMLLSELKENQGARIAKIYVSGDFARRLRDMGFVEGEEVFCCKKSVFPSPILFSVKGSRIALRRSDAEKIEVAL